MRAASYGSGGTGAKGCATTIAGGKMRVPARGWKVVVVLSEGSSDASRLTTAVRIIAIGTPHTTAISPVWGSYRTTVAALGAATGHDVLSAVNRAGQATTESWVGTGCTS